MDCSSASGPGITGDIQRRSGVVAGTTIAGTVAEIGIADAKHGVAAEKVAGASRLAMTATLAKITAVPTLVGTMVDSVADSRSAEVSPTVVVASMVEADPMAVDVAERQFC
jgi:hypothetical protein